MEAPLAVYSRRYKYIFFANPQTASKAIAKTLQQELEGQLVPGKGQDVKSYDGGAIKKHHVTWQQLQDADLMSREQLDGLFKFTSVRNPFDLLVSRYLKRQGRFVDDPGKYPWVQDNAKVKASMEAAQQQPFPEWVGGLLKKHRDKDKTVSGPLAYLDHADYVIRFEALKQGFDEVLAKLGVDRPVPIVRENVTAERAEGTVKRHYTEYYDDESRALVARVYAPILDRFAYTFG